jgi:hypothetical protein
MTKYIVLDKVTLTLTIEVEATSPREAAMNADIPWNIKKAIEKGLLEEGSQHCFSTEVWDENGDDILFEQDY